MTKSIQHTMTKNGLILAVFAIITTGLIAFTYFGTKDQITLQQQQKLLSILNAVIDESSYDNAIHLDCALVTSAELLGSNETQHIYRATKQGQAVAAAIETTAPDGYSGKIQLVVGIISSQAGTASVTGVRVLEHKETPGLGDKIDLRINNWVLDFDNQIYNAEIAPNWAVKKDGGQFDQFTGATITPRAVVNAVKLSIDYYLANQAAIFNAVNECAVNAISEDAVAEDAVSKNENESDE
jgi:electron transport complex protein RnfG